MLRSGRRSGQYGPEGQRPGVLPLRIHHASAVAGRDLQGLLARADSALGARTAVLQRIGDSDVVVQKSRLKEATRWSRIDGAESSIEGAFRTPARTPWNLIGTGAATGAEVRISHGDQLGGPPPGRGAPLHVDGAQAMSRPGSAPARAPPASACATPPLARRTSAMRGTL